MIINETADPAVHNVRHSRKKKTVRYDSQCQGNLKKGRKGQNSKGRNRDTKDQKENDKKMKR